MLYSTYTNKEKEQQAMKNITATITTSYDIKNPDQAPQIEKLGYNPECLRSGSCCGMLLS